LDSNPSDPITPDLTPQFCGPPRLNDRTKRASHQKTEMTARIYSNQKITSPFATHRKKTKLTKPINSLAQARIT
jgi:hypothetical protein